MRQGNPTQARQLERELFDTDKRGLRVLAAAIDAKACRKAMMKREKRKAAAKGWCRSCSI